MTSRRLTALIGALALLTAATPAAATTEIAEAGMAVEQSEGTILFNQLTSRAQVGAGLPVQRFDPPNPFDAEGADDFQVIDAEGWTIGEIVFGTPGFGLTSKRAPVDVRVYPDAGGTPGDAALCTYDGILGEQHGTEQLRVPLPTPCVLGPGRYWISLQLPDGQLRWAVAFHNPMPPPFVLGARAHWRNPDDGWGTGCTDWADVSTCLVEEDGEPVPVTGTFETNALFQVCGVVGMDAENFAGCGNENTDVDLTVTLAADNGVPDQCGTATMLDVEAGDRINVCYTITNTGNATLGFHWLRDTLSKLPLTREQALAPGQTHQFNRLITATRSQSIAAEAQATDVLPWYFPVERGFEFIDIAGSGTPLNLDDDGSAIVTMPFRFNVFGEDSDQLCINNNGFLLFAWDRPCDGFHQDAAIPNENVPMGSYQLAPFWDDLFTGGNVYYGVVGEEPNRRFVVQWDEKNHYNNGVSDSGGITFEVILDETTHAISFQYLDTTFDNAEHPEWDFGGDATVGFQGVVRGGIGGGLVRIHSFHQAVLAPESGLTWRSMGFFHATANAPATLNVAAPAITVAPETLAATTVQGGGAAMSLTIGNAGNRDLLWQVGGVPQSRSHFPRTPALPSASAGEHQDIDSWGRVESQKPIRVNRPQSSDGFATRAFAVRFEINAPPFGPRYARINDITDPGDTVEIASLFGRDIFGGEFLDNDFSRQFAVDECCRHLLTIDTETGETSINLGRVQGSEEVVLWHGLTWDATTDTLYAVGTDTFSTLPDTRYFLARLDLGHEVVATTIGELPGFAQGTIIIELAVDPSGRMFGVDIQGNRLFAIDKETAEVAPIGEFGFNATGALGLDFDDATNTLYLASLDVDSEIGSLYTVDTLTGEASVVGQLGDGSQHAALAIASGAPCVPPAEVPWLSVSPTEGTTAPGGTHELTVVLDAAELAVGTHEANVCIASNDPLRSVVAVPVTLTVTAADEDIALRAEGRRVAGIHTIDLFWQGATSADVDIFRDGKLITTVPNDGAHTDSTGVRGEATYRYWVCEASTSNCSSPVIVKFGPALPGP